MADPTQTPAPAPPTPPGPPTPPAGGDDGGAGGPSRPQPWVPKPVVSIMALASTLGMFVCMYLDATAEGFDGGRYVLAFSAVSFLCLGYDVSRFLRGGGGGGS